MPLKSFLKKDRNKTDDHLEFCLQHVILDDLETSSIGDLTSWKYLFRYKTANGAGYESEEKELEEHCSDGSRLPSLLFIVRFLVISRSFLEKIQSSCDRYASSPQLLTILYSDRKNGRKHRKKIYKCVILCCCDPVCLLMACFPLFPIFPATVKLLNFSLYWLYVYVD